MNAPTSTPAVNSISAHEPADGPLASGSRAASAGTSRKRLNPYECRTVYGLASSEDGAIRYVGSTRQAAARRLRNHLLAARRGGPEPVLEWIRSLLAVGHEPVVVVLNANGSWRHEVEEIERRLAAGELLLNVEGDSARSHLRDQPCQLCGLPLGDKLPRRGPTPKYHFHCGRAATWLKAAINALEQLDSLQRMRARRLFWVAANRLPTNSRRDERGRFTGAAR